MIRVQRLGARGLVVGAVAAIWAVGCEEGTPPYEVIDSRGDRDDFLPDDGFEPGTEFEQGLIYFFDRNLYQLHDAPHETPRQLVKRDDKVLAPPNATSQQLLRPDEIDSTLAAVYANPRVFAFEPAPIDSAPTFGTGRVLGPAAVFMPLDTSSGGSTWIYNHVEFLWARTDTLLPEEPQPSSQRRVEQPVRRLRSINIARPDRVGTFLPPGFNLDVLVSVGPAGMFYHGFTIAAERVEILGDRPGVPEVQQNPRALWLSTQSLGLSDPNSPFPTSVDQCLDGLWGTLELFPIKLTDSELQVGDKFTTWTYITVDSQELRRRLVVEDPTNAFDVLQAARCGFGGSPLAPTFPTGSFSLLTRVECLVEQAFDFYDVIGGASGPSVRVGRYGAEDGIPDIARLVATMYVGAPVDAPVQRLELYLQRDIGVVVQFSGVNPNTRDRTRLRRARVNGTPYAQEFFRYLP